MKCTHRTWLEIDEAGDEKDTCASVRALFYSLSTAPNHLSSTQTPLPPPVTNENVVSIYRKEEELRCSR